MKENRLRAAKYSLAEDPSWHNMPYKRLFMSKFVTLGGGIKVIEEFTLSEILEMSES